MMARTEVFDTLVQMAEQWLQEDEAQYDKLVQRLVKQKISKAKLERSLALDLEELTDARDFDAEELRLARQEQKEVKQAYDEVYQDRIDLEQCLAVEEAEV